MSHAVRTGPDLEVPDLERVTLSSDAGLEVAFVPRGGMVGTSMTLDGVELLFRRNGLADYLAHGSTFGIPLLAPWANRLAEVHQQVGDVAWEVNGGDAGVHLDGNGLAIHGLLAGASEWEVERAEADGDRAVLSARLRFGGHLDRFAAFPFAHDLVVEVELRGLVVRVSTSLTPTGEHAVPVAFGWHPYVTFPGVPRAEWVLDLPFRRRAVLDDRCIPTGEVRDAPVPAGPLGELALDDVFLDASDGAVATVRAGDRAVEFRYVNGYDVAVVYAPLVHDTVCVEPMTAPTDPFSGRSPLRLAEPGETVTAVFELAATRLPG
jgi:galactose mutarotase-like enzyme